MLETDLSLKVLKPSAERLPNSKCFKKDSTEPIVSNIILHFHTQGLLLNDDAILICREAAAVLRKEANVLDLDGTFTIVGDLHGQFFDLSKILKLGGPPSSNKYLFLGNYVGNGGFSCETILTLLSAKLAFPKNVFLLRGNNESRFMTSTFGFDKECSSSYSKQLYSTLIGAFNCLPIAAVVNKKFFCVHGGLSPDVSRIEDVRLIHRFREIPTSGAMCDLLWSDPYWDVENPTTGNSDETEYYKPVNVPFEMEPAFLDNEQRGCSYIFNFACVKHFLNVNNILCVIRSHEIQDDGYRLYRAHPNNNFPTMMSVFSAPNYADAFDNKGAVLHVSNDDISFKQFFCSPHPFILVGLNGLTWSFPFLLDSLESIFSSFLDEI